MSLAESLLLALAVFLLVGIPRFVRWREEQTVRRMVERAKARAER